MSLYHDEELINLEQESEENFVLGRHFTIGEIKKHIKDLKNNKSAGADYRGIAISICLGKRFTNILKTRLISYVEEENKFSDNQSTFRKGRWPSDHLFTINVSPHIIP